MYEEIIELVGKNDGPTSIILAGVHGDEKCGVDALKKILPGLEINKGRVLIGYGNPLAIDKGVRYTEANLNRMFLDEEKLSISDKNSYEYNRAVFLKKYLNQADVLLDIHASSDPNSKAFIICEKNAMEIVDYLPVDLVVFGFDNVEPGGTDYYMNKIGKVGICLESGYLCDKNSTKLAEKSIYAFLKARGHIEQDETPNKKELICMYKIYITKTDNFCLAKPFGNFEEVENNQIIGVDGKKSVVAKKKSVILFAQNCKKIGSEAFLLGEIK